MSSQVALLGELVPALVRLLLLYLIGLWEEVVIFMYSYVISQVALAWEFPPACYTCIRFVYVSRMNSHRYFHLAVL